MWGGEGLWPRLRPNSSLSGVLELPSRALSIGILHTVQGPLLEETQSKIAGAAHSPNDFGKTFATMVTRPVKSYMCTGSLELINSAAQRQNRDANATGSMSTSPQTQCREDRQNA